MYPAEPGLHYVTFGADIDELNQPTDADDHGKYVEVLFPGDSYKLITRTTPGPGEQASPRVYLASYKTAIVEKDTDQLTAEDYRSYGKEVQAAILEGFRVWIDHQCFTRRPRHGATNILDVRWVGK